jgi:hypothetical protein
MNFLLPSIHGIDKQYFYYGQGPSHRLTKHGLNLIMAIFFLTGRCPPSLLTWVQSARYHVKYFRRLHVHHSNPSFILYNDVTALLVIYSDESPGLGLLTISVTYVKGLESTLTARHRMPAHACKVYGRHGHFS